MARDSSMSRAHLLDHPVQGAYMGSYDFGLHLVDLGGAVDGDCRRPRRHRVTAPTYLPHGLLAAICGVRATNRQDVEVASLCCA